MYTIAIDGPAGAGKSTIAKRVAKALDILYLDTGAMYRTVAYKALKEGVPVEDEAAVQKMLETTDVRVQYMDGAQRMFESGEDVTAYIREHAISKAASDISKHPCVRIAMVELQRRIASEQSVVMDGRDIGTFVLPGAKHKFFLTATPEERAKRRWLELEQTGKLAGETLENIEASIRARDEQDANRAFAPLKQAEDAVLIDTTRLTIDEAAERVLEMLL